MSVKGRGRQSDRRLGMDRAITRRDLLQGAAALTTAMGFASMPGCATLAPTAAAGLPPGAQDRAGYYPPRLQGLRGSQPGSFEAAHALRDGTAVAQAVDDHEHYDLVVVGAGISGLAAAHFYQQSEPGARILLLDNHDDFGGHARRNEFVADDQLQLLNGGTLMIDSPRPYSAVADGLLRAVGIDAAALSNSIQDPRFYHDFGLREAVFFDRETFGADHLAVGFRERPWAEFLAGAPLSAAAKQDVVRIETAQIDYLPALSSAEKKQRLLTLSYWNYLRDIAKVDPAVLQLYGATTHGEWGVGIDAVGALDAWGFDLPGFQGLKLEPGSIEGMGFTPAGYMDTGGSVRLHFPDGNATIARALVRKLIPAAVPGQDIADLVSARVDYGQLDRAAAPVRLRLNSTVVRAQHEGDPSSARTVAITYLREGVTRRVRAERCVLACYNMMIPYLVPELPSRQQRALHELVKAPLVYTSVAIRDWQACAQLKVEHIYAPGGFHSSCRLNPTVDIGEYRSPRSPQQPTLLHLTRTPCKPGLTEFEQNRAGRAELLRMPFEVFERETRAQLERMLGGGGFDPAHDITGIMINRWPHGYAPENNPLFDPVLPEAERPYVVGRARFGRISIANSDSGGGAYTDVAIDQAHRAVHELLGA